MSLTARDTPPIPSASRRPQIRLIRELRRHSLRTGYEQVAFPLGELWRTYARRLQHYLGHASITNTVRYTEMSPEPFKDIW